MFVSVRQCAEPMIGYTDSGSHFNVMWFTLQICVCSISPESFGGFSLNFTQMFRSVRRWAEHITQLPRLKVTGQGIYPWILCPLHISWILKAIFSKRHPNVPLSETMCRTYDLATQTQGQGHTTRSCDLPFNSCLLHISWILYTSLKCSSQWDGVQSTWPSYLDSRSQVKVKELILCVHSIPPETFERFLLNFTQMFLSVRRCAESITQLPRLKVTPMTWLHRFKVKVTHQGHMKPLNDFY